MTGPTRFTLRTRRQLRLINAQSWADFKQHWPMEVLHFLMDIGWGVLLGVSFGLAVVIYVLHSLGAVL